MNLYNLHINPESLLLFVEASEVIPTLFWAKYKNNPEELKKRERYIAADAEYSYLYARHVLKGPFPAGGAEIAADALFAYWYATNVLNGPFPAGEAEIAADAKYAYLYARDALKGPFPTGEAAISRSGVYLRYYVKDALKADFYRNGKLIAKFEK